MLKYVFLFSFCITAGLSFGQETEIRQLEALLEQKKYSELIVKGNELLRTPCGVDDSIVTLHLLAEGNRKLRKLDLCWQLCSKSMQLAERSNNYLYQIKNHEELGILYGGYWNAFPRAIHHFRQVIYLAKCFGNTKRFSRSAYNNIATMYEGMYPPNYKKSLESLQAALQYVDSNSNKGRLLLLKMAHHEAQLGLLNKSINHLDKASQKMNINQTSWYFQKWLYKAKGYYFLRNEQYHLSYLAFEAYRKIATEKDKSITGKTLAYEMLLEWAAAVKDSIKFNIYSDSAHHYLWEQNKIGDTQTGTRSLAKHEEEQVNMKLQKEELVQQLARVQTSRLDTQRKQRNAQNTNLALLLGLGFIGVFQFRIWRKSVGKHQLFQHQMQIEVLERDVHLKIMHAEVDAKNQHLQKIGQRMHDELSSTLTGLLYKIQEPEEQELNTIPLSKLQDLQRVVRHCSHILGTPEHGQLIPLLKTLATQYPSSIQLRIKGSSRFQFPKEMELFQHLFVFLNPEENTNENVNINLQISGKKAFLSLNANHFEAKKVSLLKENIGAISQSFRTEKENDQMVISFFIKHSLL